MGKLKPADLLFWLLAAVAAAALTLFVLVLGGAVPIGSGDRPVEASVPAAGTAPEREADGNEADIPAAERGAQERRSTTGPADEQGPELVTVVVRATRGDCWLSARAGSETGRVLDERLLVQGESVRLRARRVWLSLGASSNVDVLVDQELRPVPGGTVAIVLAPSSTS
ncbi:MAG TPA: hypothetical protein VNP93_02865 [Gaiellaceae bacterium]|nr:hypothetical protein [Gaiellaceae bacterium]